MSARKPVLSPYVTLSDLDPAIAHRDAEIIYQVYPASFADGNGDGHGDIKGITSKLDYIASLGAEAIWISPFYASPEGPEGDGGYAVSDYRKIADRFGTMDDFKELLKEAHARNLRVYIDFVIAHTAHDHDWFEKSRRREEPYADYYVWHDGWKVDRGQQEPPKDWKKNTAGEVWVKDEEENKWYQHYPPNNWKSVFGGIAWTWDPVRGQYYMHHFLKSQPALNLNIEKVQDASLAEMKFWLDLGVDGFRIDALPFANHDSQLRHNPWRDGQWPRAHEGWGDQYFAHSLCQPQTIDLVARIRELMDSYPAKKTTLGEAVCGPEGGGGSLPVAASYVDGEKGLDMCYTDALTTIYEYPSQGRMKHILTSLLDAFPEDGGHCNSVDNHDTPRSASRKLDALPAEKRRAALRQMMHMYVCLPGSFSMYQGQELGLPQARVPEDIPHHKIKDPTFITLGNGRDGCRTPIPWKAADKHAGFSEADDPYLPVPDSHVPLAVDRQEATPDSELHFTRRLLTWRKKQPALINGKTLVIDTHAPVLAFIRHNREQTMLCLFNLSGHECAFRPRDHLAPDLMKKLGLDGKQNIRMEAHGASFYGANPVPVRKKPSLKKAPRSPSP